LYENLGLTDSLLYAIIICINLKTGINVAVASSLWPTIHLNVNNAVETLVFVKEAVTTSNGRRKTKIMTHNGYTEEQAKNIKQAIDTVMGLDEVLLRPLTTTWDYYETHALNPDGKRSNMFRIGMTLEDANRVAEAARKALALKTEPAAEEKKGDSGRTPRPAAAAAAAAGTS